MKKMMIILLLMMISVVVLGCNKEPQVIGGEKDSYGCLGPAGYAWNETIGACVRSWELDESQAKAAQIVVAPMSIRPITVVSVETLKCPGCFIVNLQVSGSDEPLSIRLNDWKVAGDTMHTCTPEESLNHACTKEYAPVCGKIVLNMGDTIYKTFGNGCSACSSMKTVGYTEGKCSEEIEYKEQKENNTELDSGFVCSDEKGNSMGLKEAVDIAKSSECGDNLIVDCTCPEGYVKEGTTCNPKCYYSTPSCLSPSIECEKTYFCNEGTSTFWINLDMKKEGCSPACVINVETKVAEINWRCTGLRMN